MRNSKLLVIGIGLLLVGAFVISLYVNKAQAGIANTDHDLSGGGYNTNQICIFCHAPHNAKTDQIVPLWNHVSTTQSFTLYGSSTLDATVTQPSGSSKACLSCHDGVTAIDAYGIRTTGTAMTGGSALGTDLSNDHPISFTYDSSLVTADTTKAGGKVGLVIPGSSSQVVTGIPLFNSRMECASCHSVHDNTVSPFLRNTNVGSALCLKCHLK